MLLLLFRTFTEALAMGSRRSQASYALAVDSKKWCVAVSMLGMGKRGQKPGMEWNGMGGSLGGALRCFLRESVRLCADRLQIVCKMDSSWGS